MSWAHGRWSDRFEKKKQLCKVRFRMKRTMKFITFYGNVIIIKRTSGLANELRKSYDGRYFQFAKTSIPVIFSPDDIIYPKDEVLHWAVSASYHNYVGVLAANVDPLSEDEANRWRLLAS